MSAEQALADLTEISSQVESAVVFDAKGDVVTSTLDDERARAFVGAVQDLVAAASESRGGAERLTQLEAATGEGSVFVVRDADAAIAATTAPDPTVALVFYDLKTCLQRATEAPPKRRRPRKKKTEADGA